MTDDAADLPPLSARAHLYDRLPVTDDVDWWCDLAAASPDGRVLELGAGTGRLTRRLADHAEVVAVDHDASAVARLDQRTTGAANPVHGLVADVTTLALEDTFGVVALPVSLLNEVPSREGRRATVAAAAAHCRPDGRVAFALLNPLWLLAGGRSRGTIEGSDGTRVRLEARHEATDLWQQHARARLSYRFDDGERIDDELDAAAVFPGELELLLDAVGMQVVQAWGGEPGISPPAADDGAWHVVARFSTGRPGAPALRPWRR